MKAVCCFLMLLVILFGCGDPFGDLGPEPQEEAELTFLAPATPSNPWTINYGPIGGALSSITMTGASVSITVSYDTPFRIQAVEAGVINNENLVSLVSDGNLLVANHVIPVQLIEDTDNGNRGFYVFEVQKHTNQIVSGYHDVPGYADENVVNPGGQITWKPTPPQTRTFSVAGKLDPNATSQAQRSWQSLGLDISKTIVLNTAQMRLAGGGSIVNLPNSITVSQDQTLNYEFRFPVTDGTIEGDTVYNVILIVNGVNFVPVYFIQDQQRRWFGVQFSYENGYVQYQAPGSRDIRSPYNFGADDSQVAEADPNRVLEPADFVAVQGYIVVEGLQAHPGTLAVKLPAKTMVQAIATVDWLTTYTTRTLAFWAILQH